MAPVTINGKTLELDPAAHPPGTFPDDAVHSNYILVQCAHSPTGTEYEALTDLGAKVQQKVSEDTVLCRYEPSDLSRLRALDFVAHVAVYHTHFVIGNIWQHLEDLPDDVMEVDIILHDDCDDSPEDVWRTIQSSIDPNAKLVKSDRWQLEIETKRNTLEAIAALDPVRSIHPVLPDAHDSNEARREIGYKSISWLWGWFESQPFGSFNGKGEVVAVADTGFDKGSITAAKTHPAFWGQLNNGQREVRVVQPKSAYNLAAGAKDSDLCDTSGHGTAVAGCVVGSQSFSLRWCNSFFASYGERRCLNIMGTAPSANVFPIKFQKGKGDKGRKDRCTLTELFAMEYASKQIAKVHNNSWGTKAIDKGPYSDVEGYTDNLAGLVDQAMVQDPELLIIFSNGNTGDKPTHLVNSNVYRDRQVMFEKSAKNPLSVGYTFNHREFAKVKSGRTYVPPEDLEKAVNGQMCIDGSNDPKHVRTNTLQKSTRVSYASNRGPTLEGRIKPDVVAPGTGILSARSRDAVSARSHGPIKQQQYIFRTGSSFAAPLVSGMAASLRSALKSHKKNPISNPKGFLIKALIINGARDIAGAQYEWKRNIDASNPGAPTNGGSDWRNAVMPAAPNGAQGWGLVDMGRSLVSLTENGGYYTETVTRGSEDMYFLSSLPTSANELVLTVTMCYNDQKGPLIQDKLALKVNLNPTPANTTVSFKPDANATPGNDLPSETAKGGFTHSNVQRWSEKFNPTLFSSMQIVVANDNGSLSPSTEFAVAWAFTSS
jgi:serine protease AprX